MEFIKNCFLLLLFGCGSYVFVNVWSFLLTFLHEKNHQWTAIRISKRNLKLVKPSQHTLEVSHVPHTTISLLWAFPDKTISTRSTTYKFTKGLIGSSGRAEFSNHFLVYTDDELKKIAKAGDKLFFNNSIVKQIVEIAFPVAVFVVLACFCGDRNVWLTLLEFLFTVLGIGLFTTQRNRTTNNLKENNADVFDWSDEKVQEDPNGFYYKYLIKKAKNEGVDEELIILYEKRRNEVIQYYKEHQN